MEKVLFLSIIGFLIISSLIIFVFGTNAGTLFVSINKQVYTSGDIMKINLIYNSVQKMENVRIKISGIENRYGSYVLNVVDVKNFTMGENRAEYSLKLPSCSSCSGILPGKYDIFVLMENQGRVIANKTKTFELQ